MVSHATDTLIGAGATSPKIIRVPGSNELPFAVSVLAKSGAFDGIIAIGLVIAGSTNHHNFIGIVVPKLFIQYPSKHKYLLLTE